MKRVFSRCTSQLCERSSMPEYEYGEDYLTEFPNPQCGNCGAPMAVRVEEAEA